MKLSDAIIHGSTLRPQSHQDRFVYITNLDTYASDAWGAACEAVQPAVGRLDWHTTDPMKLERFNDVVRAVQQQYFAAYWQMPAVCPGAKQSIIEAGGRIVDRQGHMKIDGVKSNNVGGITSECDKVEHMAGMVDHLFYAHGWSREKVAEVVKWYEETRSTAALIRNFAHYQVSGRRLST